MEAFASGRGDASNVREALAPMMPKAGEDRSSVSDVFGNVYAQCVPAPNIDPSPVRRQNLE
jgi:hypothetical protein